MLTVNRVSGQNSDVLTLALYPYVPDIERFKSTINEEWGKIHPDIRLEFSDWDCYSETLPENVDVFVYDTVYFDQYLKQGLLLPLSKADIKDIDDFFPFAIEASTSGETIYAVPEFLCSEFLYTRKSDTEMNNIENIRELYDLLGEFSHDDG